MQDEKKCTSSAPSSTNRSDDSSRDAAAEVEVEADPGPRDAARNAFCPEFLERRQDREDEPLAAIEAEARGPWVLFERPAPGAAAGADLDVERYEVFRSWEAPETDRPAATFRFRELALLYAAGLEVGGRRSTLTVSRDEAGGGYVVHQLDLNGKLRVVGHIAQWDEDTFPAFQNLETLLRAIEPLAQVLDAAGSTIMEILGRRLMVE
jgi:hypothetical protein